MISNPVKRKFGDVANLGHEILKQRIEPSLKPEDKGKFVAIAVDSGEYEISDDDQAAMFRLRDRCPQAMGSIYLGRVGYEAAYKMRLR